VDLFNREIIGYSIGPYKTENLVKQTFMSVSESAVICSIVETAVFCQAKILKRGCGHFLGHDNTLNINVLVKWFIIYIE